MFKRALSLLIAASGLFAASLSQGQQPVYIVLYSRFYDHSHQHTTDERLQRLLPLLDKLQKEYPQSGISALFQFSGTVSQVVAEENSGLHLVDRLKIYADRKLVEIGYTGEDEPSYLYRPKPNLLMAKTPEQRWEAKAEATERFLKDFKNPVTGQPVPGLTGGLKRTQEVFGDMAFITGVTTTLGADSPATHEVLKMAPGVVLEGIPASDQRRGIEGFGFSAEHFSEYMSPDPTESPEAFWEDNALRLSTSSLGDNKPHTTDEGPEALKKVFASLNRSHVRIIKLEVASYKRYLTRRPDGSVVTDPLEWLYYHPDDPVIPPTMKPLVTQGEVEAGYKRDEATLRWLLDEFLPANPGSRFISIRELAQMAAGQVSAVSADELRELASGLNQEFAAMPMRSPDFGRAGSRFFTIAESFNLLAQSLAAFDRTGTLPASVPLTAMWGPLALPPDMGAPSGTVTVSEVVKAAARLAPKLADTEWKTVPTNAVPIALEVGSVHLNAAQLLRLMAQAYLDPSPDKKLALNGITLSGRVTFMFPKNTAVTDQSNGWTFKPATLRIGSK